MSLPDVDLTDVDPFQGPELRAWQTAALKSWKSNGFVGVVEAITGTGKTLVGITAIHKVVSQGGVAVVLVPSRALLEQWVRKLADCLPAVKVGTYAAEQRDSFENSDVIVSTVQTFYKDPLFPPGVGLLVADEVHRYGSDEFSRALVNNFDQRLGLSGSFYRNDDGIEENLLPYFKKVVYEYGYGEALTDGVVAPFHLGLVKCEFTARELFNYTAAEKKCTDNKGKLVEEFRFPPDWRDFFAHVTRTLKDAQQGRAFGREVDLCYRYMTAFSEKRSLLAEAKGKTDFVATISPALDRLSGTLVFTETMDSAENLASRIVGAGVAARPIHSQHSHGVRSQSLLRFAKGDLDVLCAPRVLDEGIDIPEAELAIIVATSQTKRQLVQRMGRVIRLKADARHARLLILYIAETSEDPSKGGHEAFLEAVSEVAESVSLFDSHVPAAVAKWLLSNSSQGS
jgi:superfamily II DNA or RNA helicase